MTTIHTLKKDFIDQETYLNEKQRLFNNLSANMIEKELKLNDIDIEEKEVINRYQEEYDIDNLINYYDEKYDQQLDKLGEKMEVFDDDALVYYLIKVVEQHYNIHQIPDKNYIANDIIKLMNTNQDYLTLLKETKNILKRLLKMKHIDNLDLQNTFSIYGIDIEQFFTRVFQDISYHEIPQELIKEIYEVFTKCQKEYGVSLRYIEIRIDILSALIRYDQTNIDEEIHDISKTNPELRFMLYYRILTILQEINNKELLTKYYQEINTVIPLNEEQKDLLSVIQSIFG